ncbi:MAG: site-specific DNA-methyltransferase [Leptospiraceae bacterium]|nr:site-specific DNA-methyltransferase [Leptospiraceae bacterium]
MSELEPHSALNLDKLEELKHIIPEAFSEGKLDLEKLQSLFSDAILDEEEEQEHYGLSWAGKRKAMQAANLPYTGTLRYAKGEGKNEDETGNIFIEGENLEVLRILRKSYTGKIKMIYIDPPYNTGNDFIYKDDFKVSSDDYLKKSGQMDEKGNLLTTNPKTSGRYHSNWLSMIYPRLRLARTLLREDGVIFISIDDNEVHNLRMVMNEIFGEENFVTTLIWQKRYTRSNNTDGFTNTTEYIVVYSKNIGFKPNLFERNDEANQRYSNPDNDPRGSWKSIPFLNPLSPEERPNLVYDIINPNTNEIIKPKNKAWRASKDTFEKYLTENRIWWGQDGMSRMPNIKRFLSEVRDGMTPINFWDHQFAGSTDDANKEIKEIFQDKVFDTPKPINLIKRMLEVCTSKDEGDIILDFFAGSSSSAVGVLYKNSEDGGNRIFINIQIPEEIEKSLPGYKAGYKTIAEISKERIRRVIQKMEKEQEGQLITDGGKQDLGFKVFKLADTNIKKFKDLKAKDLASYKKQLQESLLPFKDDAKEEDLVTEILLLEGFTLTAKIDKKGDVYKITERNDSEKILQICLLDKISKKVIQSLTVTKEQVFVCKDSALDAETKLVLDEKCILRTF